jgi:hypothetical protein
METLITIGVVIYIILSIRKALSFGKNGKKPAAGGWQEKLQEMARQIKEEMEKAAREAEGLPPVSAPPPLPEDTVQGTVSMEWENLEEEPEPPDMEESVDEESRDYEILIPVETSASQTESAPDVQIVPPEEPLNLLERRKPCRAGFRRSDLKRALIWSEILAKPVSLRE